MRELLDLNNNYKSSFLDGNIIDYEALTTKILATLDDAFKELELNGMNVGIFLYRDYLFMPLILALDQVICNMQFYTVYTMKNLMLKNCYNSNVIIADREIGEFSNCFTRTICILHNKLYIYYVSSNNKNEIREKSYIYYTSGTTNIPKEIYKTEKAIIDEAICLIQELELNSNDRILSIAPCSHTYPQAISCIAALFSKAKVTYMQSYTIPYRIIHELQNSRFSILLTTPFYYNELYNNFKKDSFNLRLKLSAGAFPSKKVKETLNLNYIYGTSETGVISIQLYKETKDYNSVGIPIEGVSLLMEDKINALESQLLRKFGMISKYCCYKIKDGNKTKKYNGYISLNDYGFQDDKGNIYLEGRVDNVININGEKVLPKEIENVILKYKSVKDVKVKKLCRGEKEYIVAYILAENKIHLIDFEKNIRQFCKKELCNYKIPKKFFIIQSEDVFYKDKFHR